MTPDRETIRFNVLRNALYHTGRRRTLGWWSRLLNLLVVLFGAAAVGDVLAIYGFSVQGLAFATTTIGALQLVFDFGGQAHVHQTLQRDYYKLLAEIEASPNDDDASRSAWYSRIVQITSNEPPLLRAIDAKAYNDAHDGLNSYDPNERLHIPLHHRILGTIFAFDGYNYQKLSDLRTRRA